MPLRARTDRLFFVVAVIFGLAALESLLRLVTFHPYGELPVAWGLPFAALGLLLPLVAALGLIFQKRSARVFAVGFDLSLLATLWAFWHGLSIHLLGDRIGIAYIVASLVVGFVLRQAFAPTVHPPSERPAQPAEHYVVSRRRGLAPAI